MSALPLTQLEAFPLVESIYDVVPFPFTQEYVVPAGTTVAPNSLRLVWHFGGTLTNFPTNPHQFKNPGNSLEQAKLFFTYI